MKNFPRDPDRDYSISNMEMRIQARLNKAGYYPLTQYEFCLQKKSVDGYFPSENFVYEIDGDVIHRNRELKDKDLRDRVKVVSGCDLREYSYKYPGSIKREKEITAEIIDNIIGLRKMRQ